MKTRFLNLLVLAALVFQFLDSASLKAQTNTNPVDQARNQFAQTLSLAMSNPAVRNFLKMEAALQFDQDYDVLYETVKNKQVYSGQSFASILVSYAPSNVINKVAFFNYNLCQLDPLLNISFPELDNDIKVENWNTTSLIPIVAVVETSFDDITTTTVNAYNNTGGLISLSTSVEPTSLIAVVGPCERVLAVNPATMMTSDGVHLSGIPSNYEVLQTGGCFSFYLRKFINIPPPNSVGPEGGDCQRDTKTTRDDLYQTTMRTTADRNWAELFLGGKLEMEAHIFFAETGLNISGLSEIVKSFSLNRDYQGNTWYTPSLDIFHWLPDLNGDKMLYYWIEDDKDGFSVEIPLSVTLKFKVVDISLGATLKFSAKDEACGSSIVSYCDPANTPGTEYNTGRVKFKVRQRD